MERYRHYFVDRNSKIQSWETIQYQNFIMDPEVNRRRSLILGKVIAGSFYAVDIAIVIYLISSIAKGEPVYLGAIVFFGVFMYLFFRLGTKIYKGFVKSADDYEDEYKYCQTHGIPDFKGICPYCQNYNEKNIKYCICCGCRLKNDEI